MPIPFASAIAGGSIVGGAIFGGKARKAKRRAQQAQQKIARIQRFQERRRFFNQFFDAQAATLASGAQTGADLSSSAVQGQLASQETQARVGINELNEQDRLNTVANRFNAKAGRYAGVASAFAAVGQIAQLEGISDKLNEFGKNRLGLPGE